MVDFWFSTTGSPVELPAPGCDAAASVERNDSVWHVLSKINDFVF